MEIMKFLNVLTIVMAELLVGIELATAAFTHPALGRQEDATHRAAASAFAGFLGRAMPPWYALAFVLIVAESWMRLAQGRDVWLLAAVGAIWAATILFTVVTLVPINKRVEKWTQEKYEKNWREERRCWDDLHRMRVCALLGVDLHCDGNTGLSCG